jgi:nucleoside-diphosphate-sugar epimerase
MMRVLVTGHLGYIGQHAVELLIAEGHYVKGVDLDLYDGCDFYAPTLPQVSLVRDVFDLEPRDFASFDTVMHFAGLSNDPLCELDSSLTWRVNHEGTMHVAECAKAAGVERFLFSSSCSIYGKSGDRVLAESDELAPITAYGETKISAEKALALLADDSFSPAYLRNATAYGSSSRLRLDLVLNNLMAWAYTIHDIRIMSDGTPWRPLVHCRDIARAFIHLAKVPREKIHNEAFNIGRTAENYQVRDVAAIVAELMPGCSISYTHDGSPDARDYRVDFTKFAEAFPDFEYQYTLRDGAAELAQSYAQHGMTLGLLEGSMFNRLRRLREGTMLEKWQSASAKPTS